MSQHRAPRRRASRRVSQPQSCPSPSETDPNHSPGRHSSRLRSTDEAAAPDADPQTRAKQPTPAQGRPSAPGFTRPTPSLIAGTAALVVAAAGAVSVGSAQAAERAGGESTDQHLASSKLAGFGSDTDQVPASDTVINSDGRGVTISRSSGRQPIDDVNQKAVEKAAAKRAAARDAALERLAELADERAQEMKSHLWVLPVDSYRLTATYGAAGGLWSADHTGLDFATSYGAPIKSVGHGIVTSTGYAGAYGNQTVITHADGTQTTYSHQANITVSPGEEVDAGEVIGYVGMTGNTTGPHLHFEVRPDPETTVDPYPALVEHGVTP